MSQDIMGQWGTVFGSLFWYDSRNTRDSILRFTILLGTVVCRAFYIYTNYPQYQKFVTHLFASFFINIDFDGLLGVTYIGSGDLRFDKQASAYSTKSP